MVASTTPGVKELEWKVGSIARTDTTDTALFVLPSGCTPMMVLVLGSTASDAGTSAVVDVGVSGTSNKYGTANVKTNGATVSVVGTLMGTKLTSDVKITGKYTEAGTASTAGGDWVVMVGYVRTV